MNVRLRLTMDLRMQKRASSASRMVTQVIATEPITAQSRWCSSLLGLPTPWVVGMKLTVPDEQIIIENKLLNIKWWQYLVLNMCISEICLTHVLHVLNALLMSCSTHHVSWLQFVSFNIIPSPWVLACTNLLHSPGVFEKARTRNWYKVLLFNAVTSLVVLFPSSVSTHGCRMSWPTGRYSMLYFTMPPLGSSGGSQRTWTVLMDKGLAWTFLGEEGPWMGERKLTH